MRGTLIVNYRHLTSDGIIPAHAGNTFFSHWLFYFAWDHPRACGEHSGRPLLRNEVTGSSPRMRGTPFGVSCSIFLLGIIPAHAGNTAITPIIEEKVEDHPRACGEHTSRLAQYRGFLIRSVCFLFSFILSTSLLAGIYWRCSIRDEEHRQKTLPSHWMAV